MSGWDLVGWIGSALLVASLLQTDIRRLRWLNLTGCVVSGLYNLVIPVWPSVGLNVALAGINLVQLRRLRAAQSDTTTPPPASRTSEDAATR